MCLKIKISKKKILKFGIYLTFQSFLLRLLIYGKSRIYVDVTYIYHTEVTTLVGICLKPKQTNNEAFGLAMDLLENPSPLPLNYTTSRKK